MTFAELLVQVRELLQSKGRVSYRALKLQFNLDDEHLDGLKDELIEAERVAADESGKVLPKEIVQQIVSKTDVVPLFVEELTKSVLESVGVTGRATLQSLDIPATLQDSLMARLDRLGPTKEIAQVGATIGREFNCLLVIRRNATTLRCASPDRP